MGPAMRIYKKRLTSKESLLASTLVRFDKYSFNLQHTKKVVRGDPKKH